MLLLYCHLAQQASFSIWLALLVSAVIMPKALSKSKHGLRTNATNQGQSDSLSVTHQSSCSSSAAPAICQSHSHHKSHRQGGTSSKAEKRWDKVLTMLYRKASAHLAATGSQDPTTAGVVDYDGDGCPPTPDQLSLQDCPIAISTTELWGSDSLAQPPSSDPAPRQESLASDPESTPSQEAVSCQLLPEQLQQLIEAAVQKSLAAGYCLSTRTESVWSALPVRKVSVTVQPTKDPRSPTGSQTTHHSVLTEADYSDSGLSDDEDLLPEQPAFMGLFPQFLFKSLLFKAINMAQLSSPVIKPVPAPPPGSLDPMFAEPVKLVTATPTPPLFLNIIKWQWTSPGSAPLPTSNDHKNFNITSDLE